MEFSLVCRQTFRQLAGMSEAHPAPVSPLPASPVKTAACKVMRNSAESIISHALDVGPSGPAARRDADRIRHEVSCLITLYEEGLIDPVTLLEQAPLGTTSPEDAAPLTGSAE